MYTLISSASLLFIIIINLQGLEDMSIFGFVGCHYPKESDYIKYLCISLL